jgi:hypothetical protein
MAGTTARAVVLGADVLGVDVLGADVLGAGVRGGPSPPDVPDDPHPAASAPTTTAIIRELSFRMYL